MEQSRACTLGKLGEMFSCLSRLAVLSVPRGQASYLLITVPVPNNKCLEIPQWNVLNDWGNQFSVIRALAAWNRKQLFRLSLITQRVGTAYYKVAIFYTQGTRTLHKRVDTMNGHWLSGIPSMCRGLAHLGPHVSTLNFLVIQMDKSLPKSSGQPNSSLSCWEIILSPQILEWKRKDKRDKEVSALLRKWGQPALAVHWGRCTWRGLWGPSCWGRKLFDFRPLFWLLLPLCFICLSCLAKCRGLRYLFGFLIINHWKLVVLPSVCSQVDILCCHLEFCFWEILGFFGALSTLSQTPTSIRVLRDGF